MVGKRALGLEDEGNLAVGHIAADDGGTFTNSFQELKSRFFTSKPGHLTTWG